MFKIKTVEEKAEGFTPFLMKMTKTVSEGLVECIGSAIQMVGVMEGHPSKVYLGTMSTAISLQLLAAQVGRLPEGAEDQGTVRINENAVLFAALLAARALPSVDGKGLGRCEFSPAVSFEAMEAFEKLTGYKPDDFIDEAFVKATREFVAEHPDCLAEAQKARLASLSQTLN